MEGIVLEQKGNQRRKPVPKVDMTPLVDLGFLLITFFIFTSSLTAATAMKLRMPAEGNPSTYPQSKTLTIIPASSAVYYYHGRFEPGTGLLHTTYDVRTGIGAVIRAQQARLGVDGKKLLIVIKPADDAAYKNLVDILDEVVINEVTKYAIVPLSAEEAARR
jgi:biopolymer transport protein ExbD